MMKVNCNVIKDLLPLYIDQVCSEETGKLVEEHTNTCDECLKLLDEMKTDIIAPVVMEKAELKRIRHPFKKIRNRAVLLCSLAVLFALGVSMIPPLYREITTEKYNIEINSDIRTIDFTKLYEQLAAIVGADDGIMYSTSMGFNWFDIDNNYNIKKFGVSFLIIREGKSVHFQTRLIKDNRLQIRRSWNIDLNKEEVELRYMPLPLDFLDRIPWDHLYDNLKTKDYDFFTITNMRTGDEEGNIWAGTNARKSFMVGDNGEITQIKEKSALPSREYQVLNFSPAKYRNKNTASGQMEIEYFFKVK